MKKTIYILIAFVFSTTVAYGHGNISKLPDSVQILQYKMALHLNKDDVGLRNKLAMAYFRNNQLTEAQEQLELVLDKDKVNFDALDGMGIVLFKLGENKKALKYFKKAVAMNSEDVMVHVHLALNYKKLELSELSKKEMGTARSLASSPEDLKKIEEEIEILTLVGS